MAFVFSRITQIYFLLYFMVFIDAALYETCAAKLLYKCQQGTWVGLLNGLCGG